MISLLPEILDPSSETCKSVNAASISSSAADSVELLSNDGCGTAACKLIWTYI